MIVASTFVGAEGFVHGVDLTEAMVARANLTITEHGIKNAHAQLVHSEQLPFEKNTIDIVISNGVINLSPCKQKMFSEIFRVLKPGGKLQFADIILEKEVPTHMQNANSWSD